MPTLEQLQFDINASKEGANAVGEGLQSFAQARAQNKYQQAAKEASDAFLAGDPQRAASVLMRADPELARGILQGIGLETNKPQILPGANPDTGKAEYYAITGAGKSTPTGVGYIPKTQAGGIQTANWLDPADGNIYKLFAEGGQLKFPDGSPVPPEMAKRLQAGYAPQVRTGPQGETLQVVPNAKTPVKTLKSSAFTPVEQLSPEEINNFIPQKVQRDEYMKQQTNLMKLAAPFKQTFNQLGDVSKSLDLAEQGNPLTAAALKKQVAKGVLKEVGSLAQHDTQGVTESEALYDQINQYLETLGSGNLSADNIAYLRNLIDAYTTRAKGVLKNEYLGMRDGTLKTLEIPPQYIDRTLGKSVFAQDQSLLRQIAAPNPASAQSGQMIRVQSPNGQFGTIPAANLKKALSQGFKQVK